MLQTANKAPIETVGVLLAAGAGYRFDMTQPGRKLDVLIDGVSVAQRSLEALAASTDAVVVVARSMASPLVRFATMHSHVIVFPASAQAHDVGMGHSLACGAARVIQQFPGATSVVIALADMPWVGALTIARLVAKSRARDNIVQPLYAGKKGHPVVFPARYLSELAACRADVGARNILRTHASSVCVLEVDDAGVLCDIDVPQDITSRL